MICHSFHVCCIPCGFLPGVPLHFLWPGAPPSGSSTSVGSTAETSEKCHSLIVTCLSRQTKALSINSQRQHGEVTACSKLLPFLAQHTLRREVCSSKSLSNHYGIMGWSFPFHNTYNTPLLCHLKVSAAKVKDLLRHEGTDSFWRSAD